MEAQAAEIIQQFQGIKIFAEANQNGGEHNQLTRLKMTVIPRLMGQELVLEKHTTFNS